MRLVIQRVNFASVSIDQIETARIEKGLLLLLGISDIDNEDDITWVVHKVSNMRIFGDKDNKMNLSLLDISGQVLIISQFTLFAQTKKGNRPSFISAASPNIAIPLYHQFIKKFRELEVKVESGTFGADMKVSLLNDGPVTIIIDSKNRE